MKQIDVYEFSELDSQAQIRAKESCCFALAWWDEYVESIQAYADHYGMTVRINDAERMDYDIHGRIRGHKLRHIPSFLTGFCVDETIRLKMKEVWSVTGNADEAFRDAIHEVLVEWNDDIQQQWDEWEPAGYFTSEGVRI